MFEVSENSNNESFQQGKGYFWRNPENGRYYSAILTRNLFQEWVIIKAWGGSRAGHVRYCPYESFESASSELEKLRKYREKRGYISV